MNFVQTIERAFKQNTLMYPKAGDHEFIIGARFTSGAIDVILVEEATDGYLLGRIRNSKGEFSKTIRTIQTATIEYFERVEK